MPVLPNFMIISSKQNDIRISDNDYEPPDNNPQKESIKYLKSLFLSF